ncbi:TP901 family phage tail tape measure protein [Rhodococcus sp. LBL1]|nr:TP901 family phage tail tape measure protein [Rhodococcus sp. LBL1]MDH6685018.1 TP901 family phage tail tape measure protein [Rhodococcus sp. LBL2]
MMTAGGRIAIEVEPDLKGFNSKLEGGLKGAVGVASKMGGLIGVSIGAGVAFQKVISLGNDYTNTLNTMQAVSQATASEMAQISERAKQLGNDASLPNTSASDAAAAMTELAKGGFSVEQSMNAAKGTLQLAAAAQIDAASAATIQSQALQAFSLDAGNAAHVADVLANVSNASSGEMTDFAYGLQQAGTVANGFGVSIEDTSATLGMLANAGITGSDAGTLLKTSLLALTDQGKPAQAAIEELGLTIYNAEGKFVGMRSLLEQLKTASGKMTEEQYQAATATLFGSDAMRMASIAAKDGVASWDAMRGAIDRQGSAAEVAAAKTQGLPGAIAAVQNSAETLALELYDLIDGPLESFAKTASDKIEAVTPAIVGGLSTAGSAVGDLGSALFGLPTPALAAMGALVAARVTGVDALASSITGGLGRSFKGLRADMQQQQIIAEQYGRQLGTVGASMEVLSNRVPAIGKLNNAYLAGAAPLASYADKHRNIAQTLHDQALKSKDAFEAIDHMGRSAGYAATGGLAKLGSVAGGTVSAGLSGMKSLAGGLLGALGGPWVVGIGAAAAAIGFLADSHARAEQKAREQEAAERALGETLDQQTGKVTEATRQSIAKEGSDNGYLDRMESYNLDTRDYVKSIQGDQAAYERIARVGREHVAKGIEAQGSKKWESYANAGIGRDELVAAMLGEGDSSALDERIQRFNEAQRANARIDPKSVKPELDSLGELKKGMDTADESAITLTEHINDQRGAIERQSRATLDENKALGAGIPITESLKEKFTEYGATIESVPDEKTVFVRGLTDDAQAKLRELGFSVERFPDGSFKVVANTDEAKAMLADAIGRLNMLANEKAIAHVSADKTEFDANVDQARNILRILSNSTAAPQVAPILDKLKEGKRLTIADLQELSAKVADPKVIAQVADALRDINAVDAAADNASRPRKLVIDVEALTAAENAFHATGQFGPAPRSWLEDRADGGRLPGFEGGGRMPPRAATDDIYAMTPGGKPIAMVNGREWVINDKMSDKYDRELAMINAGTFPKLPGFENGGRIAAQRAHAGLARENGKPYGYSEVGSPSWDCSSYSSLAYALLKGLDGYTRWYTTESDFLSLGFRPGMGPSSALNIGVHNGGGGPNSHMASMLDGVAFESSSSGVQYGGGAARPTDSQFEKQYHLPASQFSPPGDSSGSGSGYGVYGRQEKKATWTEKDELSLESARIAITQAKEARDKTFANGKKSPADRDQAESKVKRAEERVRSLEAKKRAAEAGANATAAPAAPDLATSYTDEQIRLKELQWAIDEADAKRNEVYDDPDATDKDRERADIDLQKAMNALTAEQKQQRGDKMTVGDIIGTAVKDAAMETLGGTLDFIGVDADKVMSLTASQAVPTFSAAELAMQGPEVPGTPEWKAMIDQFTLPGELLTPAATPRTPEWVEQLLERTKNPFPTFLRDMGGVLPDGAAALNLSGETEWVQTAADRRRYEVDMRDLAALRAQATNAGVAPAQLDSMIKRLDRIVDTPRGPLLNVEQLIGNDMSEALEAAGREAHRLVRSEAMIGGWGE